MPLLNNGEPCNCTYCIRDREQGQIVQETDTMPEVYMSTTTTSTPEPTEVMLYCYNCDSRVAQSTMVECSTCQELNCADCAIEHNHDGRYCDQCDYGMSSNDEGIYCRECDGWSCRNRHDESHIDCTSEYERDDPGRYNGRPAVQGWGREAVLSWMDDQYVAGDTVFNRRAAALEIECEYGNSDAPHYGDSLTLSPYVGVGGDGSLMNGIEITTPPAKGFALENIVRDTMSKLSDHGYHILDSCGMHTHIDLRDKMQDTKFLSHLFNLFFATEDILFAMQYENRHNSTFSIPLRRNFNFFDVYGQNSGDFDYKIYKMPKTFDGRYNMEREKERKYAANRYSAFNFHSVYFRGSLEVRLHEGSLNAEDALRWIDLLQYIIARAEKGHSYKVAKRLAEMSVTVQKINAFARYIGLPKDMKEWLIDRVNRGQGMNFRLGTINWGTPRRGRPMRHDPVEQRFTDLQHVGREVECAYCYNTWVLRRAHVACPNCSRRLRDHWGDNTYRLSPRARRGRTNTTGSRVTVDFDFITSGLASLEDDEPPDSNDNLW